MKKVVLAKNLFIQDIIKGLRGCEETLGLYVRYNGIGLTRHRLMCLLDIETQSFPGWIL